MRVLRFCFLLPVMVVLFSACEKIEERPSNYLKINGKEYILLKGLIDDEGTDSDIEYRRYDFMFTDDVEESKNYFKFSILSNSTNRLQEGVYTYTYSEFTKGVFTNTEIGLDFVYDSKGEVVEGTKFREYSMSNFTGTIEVSQEEGDYKFDMDFSFTYDGENYEVEGVFWDVLTESYVVL